MSNWPIQVGGEYRTKSFPESQSKRVTAIDGDMVHFIRVIGGRPDSNDELPANVFRMVCIPEDQSPMPALIEALEDLLDAIPKQTDDADWWEDHLTFAVREARAVLAAVSEHPSNAVAEEVTA